MTFQPLNGSFTDTNHPFVGKKQTKTLRHFPVNKQGDGSCCFFGAFFRKER